MGVRLVDIYGFPFFISELFFFREMNVMSDPR